MPSISLYVSDKLYADLAAAMLPLGAESPGAAGARVLSRVFGGDRNGARVRSILQLEGHNDG